MSDIRPQLPDVYGYFKPRAWNLKELGEVEKIEFYEYTVPSINPDNNGKTTSIVEAYRHLFENTDDLVFAFGDSSGRGCPSKRMSIQHKIRFGPIHPSDKSLYGIEHVVRQVLVVGHGFTKEQADKADIQISRLTVKRGDHILVFGSKREKEKIHGKTIYRNFLFLSSVNGESTKGMPLSKAQGYVEGLADALCEFKKKTVRKSTTKECFTCSNSGKYIDIFE